MFKNKKHALLCTCLDNQCIFPISFAQWVLTLAYIKLDYNYFVKIIDIDMDSCLNMKCHRIKFYSLGFVWF